MSELLRRQFRGLMGFRECAFILNSAEADGTFRHGL
jgi:hypothetical protein